MAAEAAAAAAAATFGAYVAFSRLPRGAARVAVGAPLVAALAAAAWRVPTVHLRSIVSFFFLWMIPFKLLLFALSPAPLPSSALRFLLSTASIPVLTSSSSSSGSSGGAKSAANNRFRTQQEHWLRAAARALLKLLFVVAIFTSFYRKRHEMPHPLLYLLFSLHIYLAASLIFELLAAMAAAATGAGLDPPFDRPYLASSLTDFWGRRWNRMVNAALRACVYDPMLLLLMGGERAPAAGQHELASGQRKPTDGQRREPIDADCPADVQQELLAGQQELTAGQKLVSGGGQEGGQQDVDQQRRPPLWARGLATLTVFAVSGVMHEVIFAYMNRSPPSFEVSCFFLVNGAATVTEVMLRRSSLCKAWWRPPRLLSSVITLAFVYATACWLFFPPIHRTGTCLRALDEFDQVMDWALQCSLNLLSLFM